MAIPESRERLIESFEQAQRYHADGQFEQAIEIYTHLLDQVPGQVSILVQRGLALQEAGDLDGAIADYNRALTLDPDYGPAYYGRGWARGKQGNYAGELADAECGLALDPDNAGMYYRRRGHAYHGLRDFEKALGEYTRALDLAPNDEGTRYNRALCYQDMGDFARALADLDAVLVSDPDWGWALVARARVRLDMGDAKGAHDDLSSAIEHNPANAEAWYERGRLFEKIKAYDEADADYARAGALDSQFERKSDRGLIGNSVAALRWLWKR
jgi:tetratricopeptide (TPR) repeat protein